MDSFLVIEWLNPQNPFCAREQGLCVQKKKVNLFLASSVWYFWRPIWFALLAFPNILSYFLRNISFGRQIHPVGSLQSSYIIAIEREILYISAVWGSSNFGCSPPTIRHPPYLVSNNFRLVALCSYSSGFTSTPSCFRDFTYRAACTIRFHFIEYKNFGGGNPGAYLQLSPPIWSVSIKSLYNFTSFE